MSNEEAKARAEFEAWAEPRGYSLERTTDSYKSQGTKSAWRGWWAKARKDEPVTTALREALAVIEDYLTYEHSGDPWEEDARAMGEMDIDDYKRDGRMERARAVLAAAEVQP